MPFDTHTNQTTTLPYGTCRNIGTTEHGQNPLIKQQRNGSVLMRPSTPAFGRPGASGSTCGPRARTKSSNGLRIAHRLAIKLVHFAAQWGNEVVNFPPRQCTGVCRWRVRMFAHRANGFIASVACDVHVRTDIYTRGARCLWDKSCACFDHIA